MASAVDYGLQLYFIVTKIVTCLLSGAVFDGARESSGGRALSRVFGRAFGRCSRLHAAYSGPHYPAPSPATEPPIRTGQRSSFRADERASTTRPAVRYLSPPSSRLPDHGSGPHQESRGTAWRHAQRPGSQAGSVDNQRTSWHSATTSGAASSPSLYAARLEDLTGPCPEIVWLCMRDSRWYCLVEALATTALKPTNLAFPDRTEPGLLRGDHALRGPGRSPSHPSATTIAPRHRSLRLAHVPDELSTETHPDSLAEPGGPVRRRLRSATRFPSQGLETPRSRPFYLPDGSNLPDGHRPAPLSFSTSRQTRWGDSIWRPTRTPQTRCLWASELTPRVTVPGLKGSTRATSPRAAPQSVTRYTRLAIWTLAEI
jgi:hypothetical protein